MATVEMGRERRSKSRTTHEARGERSGLKIESRFCPTDVASPFDTVQWETRSAAIKDESGKVLFEQTNCEVPSGWSQLATNVVVSKYFYGDPTNVEEREYSVRQLVHRVTRTIADCESQMVTSIRLRMVSGFIATSVGSACINTGHSTRRFGSTSVFISNTMLLVPSAIGATTSKRAKSSSLRTHTNIRRAPLALFKA